MNKKLAVAVVVGIACAVVPVRSGSAHVLLRDDTKTIGAVLHVTPDDDPVAGQLSSLYFDIQTNKLEHAAAVLTIVDATTGTSNNIQMSVEGTLVSGNYTFPTQGVYQLKLNILANTVYSFSYDQRVARGTVGNALDTPSYPWANFSLVLITMSVLLLGVIAFNRRRDIKVHSTF